MAPTDRVAVFFIDMVSLLIVFLYPLSSYIYFCQEPRMSDLGLLAYCS